MYIRDISMLYIDRSTSYFSNMGYASEIAIYQIALWNASPNFVFEVSSSDNVRRLLDQVDQSQFTVLL